MKTLFVLRHAKTEKALFGQEDKERCLSPAGEQAARHLGSLLKKDGRLPQALLVSDALRARQSSAFLLEGLETQIPLELYPELYNAEVQDVLGLLAGRPEDALLVLGHNPCMEEILEVLGGEYEHLRPCTCVILEWDVDTWEALYAKPLPRERHFYRSPD